MGRKQVTKTVSIINNIDITTDPVSEIVKVDNIDFYSIYLNWAGAAPNGEVFIDITPDDADKASVVPVWHALVFLEQILVTGNSGDHKIEIDKVDWKFFRVRYVNNSGTGNITAKYKGSTKGA